jgi:nitroreductase
MAPGGDLITPEEPFPSAVPAILRARRTIFHFDPDPIPAETIRRWLEVAVWVPNHHLTEPWAFYVLGGALKARLADLAAALAADKHRDKPHVARITEDKRQEFLTPPVVIVVVQRGAGTRDAVGREEDYAACCLATYNLLLAAWADGVGSYWSTGRLSRSSELRTLLGIPPDDRVVAIVRLGKPARIPPMRRRPAADVTYWLVEDGAVVATDRDGAS